MNLSGGLFHSLLTHEVFARTENHPVNAKVWVSIKYGFGPFQYQIYRKRSQFWTENFKLDRRTNSFLATEGFA